MSAKPQVPALEGWFTMDAKPQLLGSRCVKCGTFFFPKKIHFCKNPACDSETFEEVPLSRTGKIWSYTNACYKPPEPFIAAEPYEPFSIAAVELDAEQMIVLGQVIGGVDVSELAVGMPVELVLEPLFEDDESIKMTWKWKPAA
ncbi:MAG TPA: Zn-ribbon domain-containing OB-fold protein [Pseudomonadales bacterium]|jgi:hypothetical protein